MKMQFTNNQEDLTIEKVGTGRKDVYRELEYLQPYVDKSKYVDMGLPSGRLWAKCNIDLTQNDKFASSEYSYDASFFSWGNIDGHNPTGGTFDYDFTAANYELTDGYQITGNIPPVQDAARANLNTPWRMPSKVDFEELLDNTIFIDANGDEIPSTTADKRITMNGVLGVRLKSVKNGNILFFARIGFVEGTTENQSWGVYATTTPRITETRHDQTFFFGFSSSKADANTYTSKACGAAIRPVI